jgi:hypothetical protein
MGSNGCHSVDDARPDVCYAHEDCIGSTV